jgi:hypothetical protein
MVERKIQSLSQVSLGPRMVQTRITCPNLTLGQDVAHPLDITQFSTDSLVQPISSLAFLDDPKNAFLPFLQVSLQAGEVFRHSGSRRIFGSILSRNLPSPKEQAQ